MASNPTSYSNPRFGVEKLLICPLQCSAAVSTPGVVTQHYLTEDIIITEAGEFITTAVALSAAASANVQIRYSSNSSIWATITVGDTSANGASGAVVKYATNGANLSTTVIMTAGGYLQFYNNLTGDGTGSGIVYIKYKEAFVTP